MNYAFIEGSTVKTLWLHGIHHRTAVKADSKAITGNWQLATGKHYTPYFAVQVIEATAAASQANHRSYLRLDSGTSSALDDLPTGQDVAASRPLNWRIDQG
ncbi:hypothetical protein [Xanthomonas sacchari]|uniref:hypothetical protein n=1 Tax=Xanthomonas sacchari TaxID=56458 RepID=UPI0022507918|nr:hypothetical protein [Xanthomonas sacchari]UYK71640.1 hypothetical protein NG828_15580 [Xanthomonas sacchari]